MISSEVCRWGQTDERRSHHRRASNCNDSILERLSEHFEDVTLEFGQLIEEDDAVVRPRHLPRHGDLAAAEHADAGDGVVRGATGPGKAEGGVAAGYIGGTRDAEVTRVSARVSVGSIVGQ